MVRCKINPTVPQNGVLSSVQPIFICQDALAIVCMMIGSLKFQFLLCCSLRRYDLRKAFKPWSLQPGGSVRL